MALSTPTMASDRRWGSGVVLVVLAFIAVTLVFVGGLAAIDTLYTMSTTPEVGARGRIAYHQLLWCAAGMVVLGAAYWTVGRSRGAAILMGLAAVAAAFGLVGFFLVPILTLGAITVSTLRKRGGQR